MNDIVKEKLNKLKLKACADNFDMAMDQGEQKNWAPVKIFDYLLDIEIETKRKSRIDRCYNGSSTPKNG